MTLQDFVRKPFQKAFIPTFVALVTGIVWAALDHGAHRIVPALVWTFFAAVGVFGAGMKIRTVPFWMCVVMSAMWSSYAIMAAFVGAWAAFALSMLIAAYPTSIVMTRPRE